MNSETHLIAYMVIALWVQVIVADTIGLIPVAEPYAWFLIVSYAASCMGLYFLRRGKLPMPSVIPWGGALVIAWCLFIGYVNIVEVVRLQGLVEAPSRVGLSLLFVNGLVAALIAGVVVGYPVAVVYGRWGSVVAPLLGMPVFALSGEAMLESDKLNIAVSIKGMELVWLYVALRVVPAWMHRRLGEAGA